MTGDSAGPKPRSRGRRLFFLAFKWCRIAVLLLIFIVIILGLFLNHVGLPGWVEAGLQKQLENQGWKVQFSRLRLRWYYGVVAEDLVLHRTNALGGPNVFLRDAELRPDWHALARLRLDWKGVALKDGRVIWPVAGTNQPQRTLVLNRVAGELLFHPGDLWELKFLESSCLGARVRFRGEAANASSMQDWRLARPFGKADSSGDFWHRFLTDLEKVRLDGPALAQVIFHGDIHDWRGFNVNIRLNAPGVESPWGGGTNVTVVARTIPPQGSNDPIRLALEIGAESARTQWADASRLDVELQIEPSLDHLLPTNAVLTAHLQNALAEWGGARRLSIEARSQPEGSHAEGRHTHLEVTGDRIETIWGRADRLAAQVTARHGAIDYLPARLETDFIAENLQTRWSTSQWAQVEARAQLPASHEFSLFDSNQVWLARITNLPFHVSVTVSNALALGHHFDRAAVTANWQAQAARVELELTAGEASITADVAADAVTRQIQFTNTAVLRPAAFSRFLTTNAQRWLAEFDSLQTPSLTGGGRFTLPSWEMSPTNWQADVLPTLELAARLEAGSASFRGVDFVSMRVPFTLTNQVWQFPDVQMVRPEGELRLIARADETTGDFRLDVTSRIDPLALQPAITNVDHIFRWFSLKSEPPTIEAQLSGNWRAWSTLAGTANLSLTNLTFRGVPVDGCTARVTYSNLWLTILNPVVLRPSERGTADGIAIDLAEPRLYLTNAVGRLSSLAIGQAIGQLVLQTIEPYTFELPPDARAEGSIPLSRKGEPNLRFEIDGGRFRWSVLTFERLKGTVLWRGQTLTLTNVSGLWHGGPMKGWAYFDFDAPRGGSVSYDASFAGNDLKAIVAGFQKGRTNQLDGTITGRLRVTHADVKNLNSWDGYGEMTLHDGLIWDIPIFGLLSPVFNTVRPGLGNSRAKEGRATFTMTNSVIHSDDLEIVANATRLRYKGKVDFDGHVSAKVEAELMREVWGIGPIISTVFWPVTKLLRYSITGTLADPQLEPLNPFSRLLMLPFLPFKALNEILTPDKKEKKETPPEKPE